MTPAEIDELRAALAHYRDAQARRLFGEHIATRRRPLETLLVRHADELIAAVAAEVSANSTQASSMQRTE